MSGHSKWDTIKHKKAINDAKKGKSFSKISAEISHAAKQGGGDPNMNPTLRMYVDKARSMSFPMDKIEKAIEKGVGGGSDGTSYEEITYEGFGPCGIQLIVDTLTDNKNRTVADLRKLFEEIGGTMGTNGSVSWNFDTKGYIQIQCGHLEKSPKYGEPDIFVEDNSEEVMLEIMDMDGVLDIEETEVDGQKGFDIYTQYNKLGEIRDAINDKHYVMKELEIIKEAKMPKELSEEDTQKAREAIERLEDNDDVQNVWTDLA
ncbi:YebC/PmpR family DNA-binding transcriptional regulator [bacterium]|nr:YebC/PmpR family DNA-binding transcriptional regulator [bacterium]